MSEKWTFTVITDEPGGQAAQVRVSLEDREAGREATIQIDVAGVQVDVDDRPRDYEAPEWKVRQIFTDGGLTDVDGYLVALKTHLRAAVAGS